MTEKLRGVYASIIATQLNKEGEKISGADLELLDFINRQPQPISVDELAKKAKLSKELVEYVLKRLYKRHYVTRASPEWKITAKGKAILKKAHSVISKTKKFVDTDTYLSILASTSKPLIR